MKGYNKEYKIKVNRTFFEKENLSKFNNKKVDIPTKKSILYKLKFNPEIIINEFHQTSNNINTNINIKKYKQYNSKILNRNNNSIFDDNKDENLYAFNKYYHSYDMDDFKKEEDNDEYISKKTYTNRKTNNDIFKIMNNERYNSLENNITKTSRIQHYNSKTFNVTRNAYAKSIKFNHSNSHKIKLSDYIIPNKSEEIKISKYSRPKTERNLNSNKFNIRNDIFNQENNVYSNKRKKCMKNIRYLSQEEIIIPKYDILDNKNRKTHTDLSNNINENCFGRLTSYSDRKMNDINSNFLYISRDNNENIYKKIFERNVNGLNSYRDYNDRETLNLKLMKYRIILFKQFYIHFEKYFKAYIRDYKEIFLNMIKYQLIDNDNKNNNSGYFKKSKNIQMSNKYYSSRNDNKENSLLELYKFSTSNYKNKEIKSSLINKNLSKPDDILYASLSEFPRNVMSSSSSNCKNINSSKGKKHFINKNLINSIIISPRLQLRNKLKLNTEISIGNDIYEKENELFRSFEELTKKGEQIIRRKRSKNEKDKNLTNIINEKNLNKNTNINKIKDSKEYNQFSKLRKQFSKKKNNNIINYNKMKMTNTNNPNNKLFIKYKYKKTFYNYHPNIGKGKEIKTDGNNNIKKKILIFNKINNKKNNISNIQINNNIKSYEKFKIDNNKKFLINNKATKNIKNNKENKINKKSDIKQSVSSTFNENRKNINISPCNFIKINKVSNIKNNLLNQPKNNPKNSNNNTNIKNKDKQLKIKQKLSSIKEEEISNPNSIKLQESVPFFNLSNDKIKDNHKEPIYLQFINIIETILINAYKRILFYRIKTINIVNKMNEILFNNDNNKIVIHKKIKNEQIYNKKYGIKTQNEILKKENKNGIEQKIRQIKDWNNKIKKLKNFLILYTLTHDK